MRDFLKFIHQRNWLRYSLIILIIGIGVITIFMQFLRTLDLVTLEEKASQESAKLVGSQYTEAKSKYSDLVASTSVRQAIDTFRNDIQLDVQLLNSCHPIIHEIGHAAYESLGFAEAISQLDEVCNSGYIHGVIEQHFSGIKDIESGMLSTCSAYSVEKFLGWQCYHGLGHGAMFFTNNDLPKSLTLCSILEDQSQSDACINGVYMENFLVDDVVHTSKYVSKEDIFYPCTESYVTSNYGDCYLYATSYFFAENLGEYETLFERCHEAGAYESSCITGIGYEAMKLNISDPLTAEAVCAHNSRLMESRMFNICILGALDLYSFHYGGLEELAELCPNLSNKSEIICNDILAGQADFFSERT